jgi:hypothetical protein
LRLLIHHTRWQEQSFARIPIAKGKTGGRWTLWQRGLIGNAVFPSTSRVNPKPQWPNAKGRHCVIWALELGHWDLIGFWVLGFGHLGNMYLRPQVW